jgi:SagB-type dehydrogenase family enzyme
MKRLFILFTFVSFLMSLSAQDIKLVPPTKSGGKPLMDALSFRQSDRSYIKKELPAQVLSDLLWAAYGFNREDKRTVPSSQNRQEIDVYVMFSDGVYLYDAKENILRLKVKGDYRKELGNQPFVMDAAINIIYVGNLDKASNREAIFIDTGFICQNVYLYAASVGLGTVARASFNRPGLHNALQLSEKQEITLVQPVGYTK